MARGEALAERNAFAARLRGGADVAGVVQGALQVSLQAGSYL